MSERFGSFHEFLPHYLREHGRRATRAVHIVGTWTAVGVLVFGLLIGPLLLVLLAPVIGYGCAWLSHLLIEHNRPATFTYPDWSLCGDLRLAWLAATRGLGAELRRHDTA